MYTFYQAFYKGAFQNVTLLFIAPPCVVWGASPNHHVLIGEPPQTTHFAGGAPFRAKAQAGP